MQKNLTGKEGQNISYKIYSKSIQKTKTVKLTEIKNTSGQQSHYEPWSFLRSFPLLFYSAFPFSLHIHLR